MNRREFISLATAVSSLARMSTLWASDTGPEIAFTFDDPKTDAGGGLSGQQINERILGVLARRNIKSVLFVCGKRVDSDAGKQLVAAWDRAGHDIANHSYSHLNFNASGGTNSDDTNITLAEFEADALKNESLIRNYPRFVRLFRYPFFKEGDTVEKRDGMRSFLSERGYRIGRATIDASDWAISSRLENRAKENPNVDLAAYGNFFLQHIWERAQFYDALARRVLNHPARHTVLLHHNALNALFLDQLIAMFVAKGWNPIDSDRAYADPVYELQPHTLPAGESLIWALAKQTGRFEKDLRYPGEDDVYENPKMDALKL